MTMHSRVARRVVRAVRTAPVVRPLYNAGVARAKRRGKGAPAAGSAVRRADPECSSAKRCVCERVERPPVDDDGRPRTVLLRLRPGAQVSNDDGSSCSWLPTLTPAHTRPSLQQHRPADPQLATALLLGSSLDARPSPSAAPASVAPVRLPPAQLSPSLRTSRAPLEPPVAHHTMPHKRPSLPAGLLSAARAPELTVLALSSTSRRQEVAPRLDPQELVRPGRRPPLAGRSCPTMPPRADLLPMRLPCTSSAATTGCRLTWTRWTRRPRAPCASSTRCRSRPTTASASARASSTRPRPRSRRPRRRRPRRRQQARRRTSSAGVRPRRARTRRCVSPDVRRIARCCCCGCPAPLPPPSSTALTAPATVPVPL